MTDPSESTGPGRMSGKRVAFVGRLGSLSRRDAGQLVKRHGGTVVDSASDAELIVLGAEELPLADEKLLDAATRQAVDQGRAEVVTETQLWEHLGLLETDPLERKLYTPAMLAELLTVPVAAVRRWHRRGLIVPIKEVHRLPYFDFQEVTTVRRLANMIAAGISPAAIEKKLDALSRYVRGVDRSLAQLSLIVEGRQILLRQEEGLVEPSGQLRFDFESLERDQDLPSDRRGGAGQRERTIPFATAAVEMQQAAGEQPRLSPEGLLRAAEEAEAMGELDAAADHYRAALALGGARADLCFQFAELLYRRGELAAARERYYMAIELDESFVEARANLGCVLADNGELELAVAAFHGALSLHPDYADVHYHLARTLGELGRHEESLQHWREFLRLVPDSPWADEARRWLAESDPRREEPSG